MKLTLPGMLAIASLAGCAQGAGERFLSEAGATGDPGFGSAVLSNAAVQSGEQGYAESLNARFAASVPTTINFAFNSAALDAAARAVLQQQAIFIRQFPEVRFRVYGHTDLVGSQGYNQSLGLRRAQAAVSFLVSQGISRSRLEAVVSLGETQPVVATQGPERTNRRTVTEVTGFVQNNPMILNGRYAEVIFRDYVDSAGTPATIEGVTTQDLTGG